MDDQLKTCREAFEKWAIAQGHSIVRTDVGEWYAYWRTQEAWEGWQAAWNTRAQAEDGEANYKTSQSFDSNLIDDGEADEVVCEVMAIVRDNDEGPYLEFTGEGGLHDIPAGTLVFLLSGGDCMPEDGWMSLYTQPPRAQGGTLCVRDGEADHGT